MTIEKTWTVEQMPCVVQPDGDCTVTHVQWRLTGTDGTNIVSIPGNIPLTRVEGTPYTPYDQLTQEQVINWVKDTIGTERIDIYNNMIEELLVKVNAPPPPKPIIRVLPWASPLIFPPP